MRALLLVVLITSMVACSPVPESSSAPGEGAIRLGAVLGRQQDDQGFSRADSPRAFEFPSDHHAHPAFRSEWWYLTLVLEDANGRTFGAQFTVFRQAMRPPTQGVSKNPWALSQVWLGHFAMTDVANNNHVAFERWSRDHPLLAGVKQQGGVVQIGLDDWSLQLHDTGGDLMAASGEWQVAVQMHATRPVVLQGNAGLSQKSAAQASYYYSWPRLEAKGSVMVAGKTYAVKGLGWFDHEWSTSVLAEGQLGWSWFALHLDDGRSIMAFRLRRRDGSRDAFDHGVLVQANGNYQALKANDFQLEPEVMWRDPDGIEWPIGWVMHVGDEVLVLRTPVNDQRMLTRIPYWEGIVHAQTLQGNRVGSGYMELTGY